MDRRVTSLIGSLVFFCIAPATVAGWIPRAITGWRMRAPFLGIIAFRWLGAILIAAGAIIVIESFLRFALKGLGTPAPVAPPRRLVVSGLYRYVRNPMYVGVLDAILGQALVFGSVLLLGYAALVWIAFSAFVILNEEPTLARKFGPEFEEYRAHVGRWWPRLTPWRSSREGGERPHTG